MRNVCSFVIRKPPRKRPREISSLRWKNSLEMDAVHQLASDGIHGRTLGAHEKREFIDWLMNYHFSEEDWIIQLLYQLVSEEIFAGLTQLQNYNMWWHGCCFVQCRRVQSADALSGSSSTILTKPPSLVSSSRLIASSLSLSSEENRIIKSVRAEFERRGGFVRLFPSAESWKRYGCFLGKHNKSFQ